MFENPQATPNEQIALVVAQAKSDVFPFVYAFAGALLFEEPRAHLAEAWAQSQTDQGSVNYAALNHNVTTSSLDSLLAWTMVLPPLLRASMSLLYNYISEASLKNFTRFFCGKFLEVYYDIGALPQGYWEESHQSKTLILNLANILPSFFEMIVVA